MRFGLRPALDPELDARLVARCVQGDQRAWSALVRRYERLVYAVARGYRLSDEDLADVFQEVFAALVRGLPRMRDARALCRWLSSTTDRIALATALRRRRERAREDTLPEERPELADPREPAPVELETLEEQTLVRLALAALAARCRSLLEALYYREPAPDYAEISRDLGMPVGSIGPTRARCIEKLERAFAALREPGPSITAAPRHTSPGERPPRLRPRPRPGGTRSLPRRRRGRIHAE
ncbi:MAG TPA: sigma-70 family RNA polymerase sigma factor [Candidatus Sulfotelmatobacter sp.]|nr:sigma-70 family RNA polymerase sigma factor [Candidatus Sulfotelmatobacter sp.]